MSDNETIVSGIRSSLADVTAIKREVDFIGNAISVEDIGKFPDQNLAELLQQIKDVRSLAVEARGQR